MGLTPSSMSRSNSDWQRPARAAALERTTGPSWQWSPTSTSCGPVSKGGRARCRGGWRGGGETRRVLFRAPRHTGMQAQAQQLQQQQPSQVKPSKRRSACLLGAHDEGDHRLWLYCLSGLVDEQPPEAKVGEARVARAAARAADDVGGLATQRGWRGRKRSERGEEGGA